MNHPTREELIEFLFDESPPDRQASLADHLDACRECQAVLDSWRNVRQKLATWTLPTDLEPSRAPHRPRSLAAPVKWAATALILVSLGFGMARITQSPPADAETLRTALVEELRQELRAELQEFTGAHTVRQQEFQEAMMRTLGRLEAQRLVDYAALRRDVETLALRAEDELQTTRQGLVRLASLEDSPSSNQSAP